MNSKIKYVKLKRSDNYGFGFSILGGAGSELPPLVYDVIEGSPASKSNQLSPGDIIWEINGQDVLTYTTKEVLNCLRLSSGEITLKLKTDASLREKINILLKAPNTTDILRTAITQDDLLGVKQILAKKSELKTDSPIQGTVNSATIIDSYQDQSTKGSSNSNHLSEDDGFDRTSIENEWHQPKKPKKKSDESSCSAVTKTASQRTPCATSPPMSEDESDIESLHSFHYSPKAVDMPSAVRLAKRLFSLDGFKKSDVSRHLSKNNEFSRAVAEEYLHYFIFNKDSLDIALRKFLDKFCLSGETQERERVLVHFSRRYLDCNPGTFNSQDAVHTLTCAIMLLNTDLHSQNVGRKMSCLEFIDNLAELNDGENFCPDVLKSLYDAIKSEPLKWATDDEDEGGVAGQIGVKSLPEEGIGIVGSNPFLTTPIGSGIVYKKGYVMRKCCVDPNGKRTAFGKRSWKMWFCVIQDLVLYLHKDEQGARRGPPPQLGQNAVRLHHALAQRAHDYSKKEHVFRLQTADQAIYLLQTSDSKELQGWIDAINFVASSLSAPPMPGAVGSQHKFQRPLLPCSITKFNLMEQLEDHTNRAMQLETDLNHLKTNPPDKTAKSATVSSYKEKEIYLVAELKRYQTYIYLLRSRLDTSGGLIAVGLGSVATPELVMNELPVFEVNSCAGESSEGIAEDPSCVVPPPIPERPRPGDRCEEIGENKDEPISGLENTEEKSIQTNEKCDKKEKRKSKKEDEFKKELEKMIREKDKRDNKRKKEEETEQKLTLKRKTKEQQQVEKALKKQEKTNNEQEQEDRDVNKPVKNEENKQEPRKEPESKPEDPRIGTFSRLSALFKFNKLNRKTHGEYDVDDDEEQEQTLNITAAEKDKLAQECSDLRTTDIASFPSNEVKPRDESLIPPPLPPKPPPNSPIMRNLGTKINA